jgi:hypothetical protein
MGAGAETARMPQAFQPNAAAFCLSARQLVLQRNNAIPKPVPERTKRAHFGCFRIEFIRPGLNSRPK